MCHLYWSREKLISCPAATLFHLQVCSKDCQGLLFLQRKIYFTITKINLTFFGICVYIYLHIKRDSSLSFFLLQSWSWEIAEEEELCHCTLEETKQSCSVSIFSLKTSVVWKRKTTVSASELPHFEEAELQTEVQRKSAMACWEFSQSIIFTLDCQALTVTQNGVSKSKWFPLWKTAVYTLRTCVLLVSLFSWLWRLISFPSCCLERCKTCGEASWNQNPASEESREFQLWLKQLWWRSTKETATKTSNT